MKDYDQDSSGDPTLYLNEVTINSGFMPYYRFAENLFPEKDPEA